MGRRKLIAGNWKMNGLLESGQALAGDLAARMQKAGKTSFDLLICPPFTLLGSAPGWLGKSGVHLGAQDCHFSESGAFTGDVSPVMLKDQGCAYVILGHSERRVGHKESSELVAKKAAAAHKVGLITIICVGELEAEREQGREKDVVADQLAKSIPQGATAENTVIAYEPVWAIGTGKTATPADVTDMHGFIRGKVGNKMRILYGGSMKPDNAAALLAIADVDGGLIGGASLKADDFWAIAVATG